MSRLFFLLALTLASCSPDAPRPFTPEPQPQTQPIPDPQPLAPPILDSPPLPSVSQQPKRRYPIVKEEIYSLPYLVEIVVEETEPPLIEIRADDIPLLSTRVSRQLLYLSDSQYQYRNEQCLLWMPQTLGYQSDPFILPFQEGFARFGDKKWTDTLGNIHTSRFKPRSEFVQGLAPAETSDGGYVTIDTLGNIAVPGIFSYVGAFCEGLALAYKDQTAGFINKKGNWAIEPQYYNAYNFSEGLAAVAPFNDFNKREYKDVSWRRHYRYGFINTKGKLVIAARWLDVTEFHEGRAAFTVFDEDEQYVRKGFINTKGRVVIPARFERVTRFAEGLAAACLPRRSDQDPFLWGFIDKKGRWQIPPRFPDFYDLFSEGLAVVQDTSGRWGCVDTEGNWAVEPRFDRLFPFSQGVAVAYLDEGCGVINRKGEWLIPPVFQQITAFRDGYALALAVTSTTREVLRVGILTHPLNPPLYPD